jgi:hypothetical protein
MASRQQSSINWDNMSKLENYGFNLDIIYEDSSYNYLDDYAEFIIDIPTLTETK